MVALIVFVSLILGSIAILVWLFYKMEPWESDMDKAQEYFDSIGADINLNEEDTIGSDTFEATKDFEECTLHLKYKQAEGTQDTGTPRMLILDFEFNEQILTANESLTIYPQSFLTSIGLAEPSEEKVQGRDIIRDIVDIDASLDLARTPILQDEEAQRTLKKIFDDFSPDEIKVDRNTITVRYEPFKSRKTSVEDLPLKLKDPIVMIYEDLISNISSTTSLQGERTGTTSSTKANLDFGRKTWIIFAAFAFLSWILFGVSFYSIYPVEIWIHFLTASSYLIPIYLASVIGIIILFRDSIDSPRHWRYLLIYLTSIIFAGGFGVFSIANHQLDGSKAKSHVTTVVRAFDGRPFKEVIGGREYYLTVKGWSKNSTENTISVPYRVYEKAESGDKVTFVVKSGYLGAPWVRKVKLESEVGTK